jgi:hypothetical protein
MKHLQETILTESRDFSDYNPQDYFERISHPIFSVGDTVTRRGIDGIIVSFPHAPGTVRVLVGNDTLVWKLADVEYVEVL